MKTFIKEECKTMKHYCSKCGSLLTTIAPPDFSPPEHLSFDFICKICENIKLLESTITIVSMQG